MANPLKKTTPSSSVKKVPKAGNPKFHGPLQRLEDLLTRRDFATGEKLRPFEGTDLYGALKSLGIKMNPSRPGQASRMPKEIVDFIRASGLSTARLQMPGDRTKATPKKIRVRNQERYDPNFGF